MNRSCFLSKSSANNRALILFLPLLFIFTATSSFSKLQAGSTTRDVFTVLSTVVHPEQLDSLLIERKIYYNQHPSTGYRVLVFSQSGNNSSSAAYQAKDNFSFLYPDIPVYLSYESPYYKLKAGNFRTRLEASSFLFQIRLDFPHAFVVKDVLDIPTILNLNVFSQEQEVDDVFFKTDGL